MSLKIIDTHIHAWDFNYASYEWLKSKDPMLNRNYHVKEIDDERLQAGISTGILVQAANNFEDTDRMLFIASQTNWIAAVVCWLPLQDPHTTHIVLSEKYIGNNYFKGIRHLINDEADDGWLLQDEVIESLRMLAAHNIPYDVVGIIPAHIKTALKVAEKIPGLRMVFDHLNQPPIRLGKPDNCWRELMQEAALNKNFYAKISGLGTASGNPLHWTEEDIKPYVEFCLQQFGEDRCFCGSDWPVCLKAGSYTRHWNAYKNILESLLSRSALEKVLYTNAAGFYDLR